MSVNYEMIVKDHQHMKVGYRYGKHGIFRSYTPGNKRSEDRAIQRCIKDGEALDKLKARPQKRRPLKWFHWNEF